MCRACCRAFDSTRPTSPSRSAPTTGAAAGPTTGSRRRRPSRNMASLSTPEPEYDFPALTESDLPLIRRWLLEPHVRRWWDEAKSDAYPDDELERYRERISGADESTDIF